MMEAVRANEGTTVEAVESRTFSLLLIRRHRDRRHHPSGHHPPSRPLRPRSRTPLQSDIRTAFPAEDPSISIARRHGPCIPRRRSSTRAIRLCKPIPAGLPRVVPPTPTGDPVRGVYPPAGTPVSTHPWSINKQPNQLFCTPEAFLSRSAGSPVPPEIRWRLRRRGWRVKVTTGAGGEGGAGGAVDHAIDRPNA